MRVTSLWALTAAFYSISECNNDTKGNYRENILDSETSENRGVYQHFLGNESTHGDYPLGKNLDGYRIEPNFKHRKFAKRQIAIVGSPCQENIDCQTTDGGAVCGPLKSCVCSRGYININGYCWTKKNPGEPCLYQEQCTATFADSFCNNAGVCTCFNSQPPTITEDGPMCISDGQCLSNGPNPRLRDPNSGAVTRCNDVQDCTAGFAKQEAYYCLCPGTAPNLAGCTNVLTSYCCPRRAYACIQPKHEGFFIGGKSTIQSRWWYNSISGNCEPLAYRGTGGNGNNFLSQALCDTFCPADCSRGNPAYDPPAANQNIQRIKDCSSASPCLSGNHRCVTAGRSTGVCCPFAAFICSTRGGVSDNGETSPDSGDQHYNQQAVTRYYYSTVLNLCVPFQYFGMGGNFNNFQTKQECDAYCIPPAGCTAGTPLKDINNQPVACGNGGCPPKYFCDSGTCCLTVDSICSQGKAIGPCTSFKTAWWFNPKTRACESFIYSGCQGNDNNFDTYIACSQFCGQSSPRVKCPQGEPAANASGAYISCSGAIAAVQDLCPTDYYCYFDGFQAGCCPTRSKTCQVDIKNSGVACVAPTTRYYYNRVTDQCETFTYNGCAGNSNNFATKLDCRSYCEAGGCPDGSDPYVEDSGQIRICGAGGIECPLGTKCTIFAKPDQPRRNICCPTRALVCSQARDAGQACSAGPTSRYFFNANTKACETFIYNGCNGNMNNFATVEQCLAYCYSADCPAGQTALRDVSNRRLTTCNASASTGCIGGYTCVSSRLLQQGICCGSNSPPGACPLGQYAYVDFFTNAPLQCRPGVDSCPNGVFCQYSATLQNSFCCATSTAQCSFGRSQYLNPLTNQPLQCTPGVDNVCPTTYTCEAVTVVVGGVKSLTGYCCGQSDLCGIGFGPRYSNNQPIRCDPDDDPPTCPKPSACRANFDVGVGYCCEPIAAVSAVCPGGKQPYLTNGIPTLCTQSSALTRCPSNYTCDLYSATGSFYCCAAPLSATRPSAPTTPSISACLPPYVLLQPEKTCSPSVADSCPPNSVCSFSSSSQRYVCCVSSTPNATAPTSNPCPGNRQPYRNPLTQQPQVCQLGTASTGCPPSYGCAYSSSMQNYYCCSVPQSTTPLPPRPPPRPQPQPPRPQPQPPRPQPQPQPAPRQGPPTPSPNVKAYGCPRGTALIHPQTRTPLACRPNDGPKCPGGYTCLQSTRAAVYQCCSLQPVARKDKKE